MLHSKMQNYFKTNFCTWHQQRNITGLKSEGTQYRQLEVSLKQEYTRTIRMILISELNAKNKITII